MPLTICLNHSHAPPTLLKINAAQRGVMTCQMSVRCQVKCRQNTHLDCGRDEEGTVPIAVLHCIEVQQEKPSAAGAPWTKWIPTIIYRTSLTALEHIQCALSLSWLAHVRRTENWKKQRERSALEKRRVEATAKSPRILSSPIR